MQRSQYRATWTITGTAHGAAIQVCAACHLDRPIELANWVTCECGAQRCRLCTDKACHVCGVLTTTGPGDTESTLDLTAEPTLELDWARAPFEYRMDGGDDPTNGDCPAGHAQHAGPPEGRARHL